MNILYVSSFADPNPINSNRTSVAVVSALIEAGLNVSMMTCDQDPTWQGSLPDGVHKIDSRPVLQTEREGISYYMVALPVTWYERAMTNESWNNAVNWGVNFLRSLKPDIVHLQQWQNLWWILESAQQLGIPTVYSVNDYGLTCQRTFLIKGDGTPCNGEAKILKCSSCVYTGRSFLGKVNEIATFVPGFSTILNGISETRVGSILSQKGVVRINIKNRVKNNIERHQNSFSKISRVIVGSPFGMDVLNKCGVSIEKIHVMPWFHEQAELCDAIKKEMKSLVIGFIGRISPEKGLHILLESLSKLRTNEPITLRIAGGVDGMYAEDLYSKYRSNAGKNIVEWLGWIENSKLKDFYEKVDLTVVPSLCFETGPLSMIESLAHRRPVLCSDIAPMKWLNEKFGTGWVFTFADSLSLTKELNHIYENRALIPKYSSHISPPPTVHEYINSLLNIYKIISK